MTSSNQQNFIFSYTAQLATSCAVAYPSRLHFYVFFQFAALWVTGVLQEKWNRPYIYRSMHARICKYIQTNTHTTLFMFTPVICMHARSIIYIYLRPPWKGRFVCVRLLCDMERDRERDEFAFCTQQHDDGARRATLVSRLFWVKLPRCSICLFVCAATTGLQTNSRQTTL